MTSLIRKLSIARDFSKFPAGRYTEDGPESGQVFRETVLVPALENGGQVCVDLDGTEGYGSSFLEEAFGGLIRKHGFQRSDLGQRLTFVSAEDPSLVIEISQYLDDAVDDLVTAVKRDRPAN